jgi:hypothetical protein
MSWKGRGGMGLSISVISAFGSCDWGSYTLVRKTDPRAYNRVQDLGKYEAEALTVMCHIKGNMCKVNFCIEIDTTVNVGAITRRNVSLYHGSFILSYVGGSMANNNEFWIG